MVEKEKQGLFGMGLIKFLKEHDLRFNPRPFSDPKPFISSQRVDVKSDKLFDLHLEVAKKVDALIAENGKPETLEPPKKENIFEDYETTVLNPLKQELMQRYSLWLE